MEAKAEGGEETPDGAALSLFQAAAKMEVKGSADKAGGHGGRKKRKRAATKRLEKNNGQSKRGQEKSDHQKRQLRRAFNRNMHPNREELLYIAGRTGLAYGKVQQWFNNQRAMEKRRRVAASRRTGRPRSRLRTGPPT